MQGNTYGKNKKKQWGYLDNKKVYQVFWEEHCTLKKKERLMKQRSMAYQDHRDKKTATSTYILSIISYANICAGWKESGHILPSSLQILTVKKDKINLNMIL